MDAATSLPLDVVHINVVDVTLLGKGWMYRVNNKLRSVHPSLQAIRFRFPVDAVHDLCQQATARLDTSTRQFGLEIVDTSDLQYGYTADVGVTEVPLKKGILPHLPYTVGVVNGDLWETLRVCPIVPEWTHVVPDYTTPAMFTTEEPYFLLGCGSPLTFISLASPVFSHNLASPDLASDESLKELGFRVLKGVADKEEASQWYAIVRASLESTGSQHMEVWNLISNQDSRKACLADPTLPRRWQMRPGKLPTVLGRDPLKPANELFTACWPPAKDLHPRQWSSLATGEDGG